MPFELWCLVQFVHCGSEIYPFVYFGSLLLMAQANTSWNLHYVFVYSPFLFHFMS